MLIFQGRTVRRREVKFFIPDLPIGFLEFKGFGKCFKDSLNYSTFLFLRKITLDVVGQFCLLSILLLKLFNYHLSHRYQTPLVTYYQKLLLFNLSDIGHHIIHQLFNLFPGLIIVLHLITIAPFIPLTVFIFDFHTPTLTGYLSVRRLVGSAVRVFAVKVLESGLAETSR